MPLSGQEERLVKAIASRKHALLEDLRLHVNLPTGPGGKALDESRELFTRRLERLHAVTEIVPGDPRPTWLDPDASALPPVAVCRRVKAGKPRLMLCGHLDTVHLASSAFREFELSADGLKGTGPGCVDMKGGLVIAVTALEALEECGVEASWSFVFSSDEETGAFCSDRAIRTEAARADYGLVFEPAMANGGLVVERPGSGQFMIEVQGKAAHVGRDFTSGVSAVNQLARTILDVAALADPDRGVITNVGPLFCDQPTNVVSDMARAWGNVRFATEMLGDELGRRIDSMATTTTDPPRVCVHRSFNRPSKPATPAVMALAEVARSAAADLGQSLPYGRTGGVCDGNNMQGAGLATIDTLGVRGGGLHTQQEWIEIPSLVERCQLAALVAARLSGNS